MHHVARAQDEVVSLDLLEIFARDRLGLGVLNGAVATGDLGDDPIDDLVLDDEDVGHLAIELALEQ